MYKLTNIYDSKLPQQLNNFLNYLTTVKERSPNTTSAYKVDLVMFFRFLKLYKTKLPKDIEFEEIDISDIDDKFIRDIHLTDLYSFMAFLDNYRDNGSYAKARKVATLKSFFKFLYSKVKILDENPAMELESPKIKKRNPTYLSLEESKRLLSSIDGTNKARDYCIITLFLNCGMRLSELVNIDIA